MAYFDLMTVREMIDSAFGETDTSCPVNFNMIESVLFILARRMQLLKRHFKVQMTDALFNKDQAKPTMIVTEIKIHTKKKGRGSKRATLADELLPSDRRLTGKLKRSIQKRSRKTSLHKTPSGKRLVDDSSSGISSDGEVSTKNTRRRSSKKYASDRHPGKISHAERRTDYSEEGSPDSRRKSGKYVDENKLTAKQRKTRKHSDEMSPTGRHRAGKYSDEISAREGRKAGNYYDEMSISERRKTGKYSDEMSVSERRKTGKFSDEISLSERRKTGKFSDEISLSERRKTGKYSDEISISERRKVGKYSDDMSPDEQKKYSGKLSPAERRKGGKYSDQTSPSDHSRSSKYLSPTDEISSESAISGKSRSDKHSAQRGKVDAEVYSQKDAAGRLREAGSNERKRRYGARQVFDDDIEELHEKIYVVTRTPSGRSIRQPVLSPVVTQEQFNSLLAKTRQLQRKFGITRTTPARWDDLRSSTSMTHPKAALNMSMRLDLAETRLTRLLDVVEQIARHTPAIDVQAFLDGKSLPPVTPGSLKVANPLSTPFTVDTSDQDFQTHDTDSEQDISKEPGSTKFKDIVTHGEFSVELKRMRDGVVRTIRCAMDNAGFEKCAKTMSTTEVVVNHLYNKFQEIVKLHYIIDEFGKKVAAVDERLTFEMTTFQDNLLQMNAELEISLDKMTDALLVPKEDVAAVAQITGDFNDYFKDLSRTSSIQNQLKEGLEAYLHNLKNVEERVKTLRNRKCTRDEMFEALNDKLTLKDINGILSGDQFNAVVTDFKRTLQNVYLAIFTKECDWQRIIDEVKSKLRECAESNQLYTLKESMRKCFTKMDNDLDEMIAIVGPLKKPPTDKKIIRDGDCLCCGAPAETRKNNLSVKLWQEMLSRKHADAIKSVHLANEKIAELCIPGQPIPHPLEQDSFVCEHDCGDTVETKEVFELYIKDLNPTRTNSEYSVATSGKKSKGEKHDKGRFLTTN